MSEKSDEDNIENVVLRSVVHKSSRVMAELLNKEL